MFCPFKISMQITQIWKRYSQDLKIYSREFIYSSCFKIPEAEHASATT
ncbi:MAG: hypothetical protein LBJ00_04160 [Planctomycetaceae bacterium]|nr:hypothetical protein [Planctomycetaceae bacterium]